MQKLQCELCGSVDLIRTNDGCFQCQHCGCKYTLEQAKALLGTVETTIGTAELERLLKNAKTFLDIGKFEDAEKVYTDITKQFPDDYRGWLGLLRLAYRYCLYGNPKTGEGRISPSIEGTKQLENQYKICQKLCGDEEALAEIKDEWEHFWQSAADNCRNGKMTYGGGCDPEFFKDISPAMYELAKCGFSNAEILNSMNVTYLLDDTWTPKNPKEKSSYYFWLGSCIQLKNPDGLSPEYSMDNLPVLTPKVVDKIKSKVQKYIDERIAQSKCPYCGGHIKSSLLGKKCQDCGRKF